MNFAPYIYKDSGNFYFDPENYTESDLSRISLEFEDGDNIKWIHNGKSYFGVLREVSYKLNLFKIENVTNF